MTRIFCFLSYAIITVFYTLFISFLSFHDNIILYTLQNVMIFLYTLHGNDKVSLCTTKCGVIGLIYLWQ